MTTKDYNAQALAISTFREACKTARAALPTLDELSEGQRRLLLSAAIDGLTSAEGQYFSRAMNLLLGQTDRIVVAHGKPIYKQHLRGKIRHAGKSTVTVLMVSST